MRSIIGNCRRPDITFYAGGRIDITSRVAKQLELHDGDSIDIGQQGSEYFLYVRRRFCPDTSFGFEATVHATKRHTRNFRAWSVRLCRALLAIYEAKEIVSPQLGKPLHNDIYGIVIPLIEINLAENEQGSKI